MLKIAIMNTSIRDSERINYIINKTFFAYDYEYSVKQYTQIDVFLKRVDIERFDIWIIDTSMQHNKISQYIVDHDGKEHVPFIIYSFSNKPRLEDFIGINVFAFISIQQLDLHLPKCLNNCIHMMSAKSTYFKIPNGYANIREDQIVYIEYSNRRVLCHTINCTYDIIGDTLKSIVKRINNHNMTYINRSILINLNYIKEIQDGYISMKYSLDKLSLSKEKEKMIKFLIKNYMKLNYV